MKLLTKIRNNGTVATLLSTTLICGTILSPVTTAFANENEQEENQYAVMSARAPESKSKAMVINDKYFGRGGAQISSCEAYAFTSFGTNVVSVSVSAAFRYKKATGGYVKVNKTSKEKMTTSISFSHKNAYSIISEHNASAEGNKSSEKISVIW